MSADFDLIITADTQNLRAEMYLRDAHGNQLAYRQTEFNHIAASQLHGLFDLRNYLRNYVVVGDEDTAVAALGMCIAEQVLGAEIFRHLYASTAPRTLRIQLPGATEEENHLAAALARVPWEIARPSADKDTLGERNLLVRVVHQEKDLAPTQLTLQPGESLRVLFVFAEAPGSRPLAARLERQALRELFTKEIYPERRIEAHFLTHGVTRERLRDQIQDYGGYHLVHWSGHGHLNLLELAKQGGGRDHLSGQELLNLFSDAGAGPPQLVFLSACHSGDILRVKDWQAFAAIAQGQEPNSKDASPDTTKNIPLDEQPGYTGTAHALLQGGVPSVVAMRYAVGDDYARELAVEFYRALLAHKQPKDAAAALTMARNSLRATKAQSRFHACDHATPVLYGAGQIGLRWEKGRSPALDTRDPRLHQIAELTTAAHEHFVGRTWELAGLGADFIGSDQQPVAVITGLGGMGKTALTAESLALWQARFDWVLLYQAKPNALNFENTLRDIHLKLYGELGRYHEHVKARPADAIYRDGSAEFTGDERLERLTRNLLRALRDEAILLVLDNFETNLKPSAQDPNAAEPVWECQDAAWERCLARLAEELKGTRSRVLVTCRRPLAALNRAVKVALGPLPPGEAALYLREHAGLSRMFFSSDVSERTLAMRLLNASRFYPLLMDRLARLAVSGAGLRQQLLQALDALEQRRDFARLPELFAARPGDAQELAYLHDALESSLDQFIADASPDARRLLWMIAIANEPVEPPLLQSVWSETNDEQPTTDHQPLTTALLAVGLLNQDDNGALSCHEVVRERIRARMAAQPQERGGLSENDIRLGYADWLAAAFEALQHQNMTAALQAGSRALVYCVEAGDYDRLGKFASRIVTGTSAPRLLAGLLPHLQAAAASAPEGRPRWRCLCYLADALRNGGRPDASLPFYEQAAAQSRYAATAAPPDSDTARQAWAGVGWITGNWAFALRRVGNLDAAHQRLLESAAAEQNAGRPAVEVISMELEALRIQGKRIRKDSVEGISRL